MCRRPRGPGLTAGYPTPHPLKFLLSPIAAQLHNHNQVRSFQSPCRPPPPYQLCGLSDLLSVPHAVQEQHSRPYSQINPIYRHRKRKGNSDGPLKWERSGVSSFKNTVGYVTLYHYNSPLKALQRHLAYVWIWKLDPFVWQSEKARAHCTGEVKTAGIYILLATWNFSCGVSIFRIRGS